MSTGTFLGGRGTSWPGVEQRQAARFFPQPHGPIDLVVGTDEAIGPVRLRDISVRGIGLVAERRMDQNPELTARLYNPQLNYFTKVPMRVVYNIQHADGEWIVGCAFTRELHAEEARGLLPDNRM